MKFLLSALFLVAARQQTTTTAFAPSAFVPMNKHHRSAAATASTTTQLEARKPFIAGNWKLNPQTREEAVTLASDIAASVTPSSPDADVALFVPYVFIEAAMGQVGDKLTVGAEVRVVACVWSQLYHLCIWCAGTMVCFVLNRSTAFL